MTTYLFIAGFDGAVEQVGVAISTDGHNWQITPEPAIPLGNAGEWDAVQTSNPSVLYENGHFRMWYQGVDERNCYRIGYAESADGWTWHKRPAVMFEREGLDDLDPVPRREGYHQPLVLKEAGRYLMYFNDHRNGIGHIRVAESADGYQWQVHEADCLTPLHRWEGRGLHYPWVIQDGDGYVMWYTSEDHKYHWYLGRAVSQDGIHWQRQPADKPVIGKPTVRRFSKWHRVLPRHLTKWYPNYRHPLIRAHHPHKFAPPQSLWGRLGIWLYDNVVFAFRTNRYMSFNNSSVVKMPDGSYLMYFQSRDENEILSIGRCVSSDGIHWERAETSILKPTIQREGIEWCGVFDADPHVLFVEEEA